MKVKIEAGKVLLPSEILEAAALPVNGECEVTARPGEVRLGRAFPAPPELLDVLRQPPVRLSIDEIAAASEPDVD